MPNFGKPAQDEDFVLGNLVTFDNDKIDNIPGFIAGLGDGENNVLIQYDITGTVVNELVHRSNIYIIKTDKGTVSSIWDIATEYALLKNVLTAIGAGL